MSKALSTIKIFKPIMERSLVDIFIKQYIEYRGESHIILFKKEMEKLKG